jgi:hypothetical protein
VLRTISLNDATHVVRLAFEVTAFVAQNLVLHVIPAVRLSCLFEICVGDEDAFSARSGEKSSAPSIRMLTDGPKLFLVLPTTISTLNPFCTSASISQSLVQTFSAQRQAETTLLSRSSLWFSCLTDIAQTTRLICLSSGNQRATVPLYRLW